MPRDLLIEIGVEELPSSFLAHALEVMRTVAERLLSDSRLATGGAARVLGSPRRLALLVPGLAERQADRAETVLGPPSAVAFKDGVPTKAGEGFARKNGVTADALRLVTTDKGDYAAVDLAEAGKPAAEVLPALLAELCTRITFPKSMRWGTSDVAFGRPVQWLVGLYGDDALSFDFAGRSAGRQSRGHRFLAPAPFDLARAEDYVDRLREARVLVDFDERRAKMHADLEAAAKALGGVLVDDPFLLGECLSLVEEPFVVPGTFETRFLELPESVVVAVMRDHQRYFAVRDAKTGRLLPAYLNVVNTANDPATIARGNDRVLRARLSDAAFFVNEDRKSRLADRVPRLSNVTFQAKLGSVGDKVARGVALTEGLALELGIDTARAREAAELAKADLETLIVGEFPELQGEMGRFYALEEGKPAEIADAIRDHYRPQGANDTLPEGKLGAAISIADKVDTLVGCFGVGLVPTGSADPFALRRAALGIIRIAVEGQLGVDVDLRALLRASYALFDEGRLAPAPKVLSELEDFFRGRLRAFYRERYAVDVVDACLGAWPLGSLRDLDARLGAIELFRQRPEFESLAVAFKRAHNIAKDAAPAYQDALLEDGAERALAEAFAALQPRVDASVASGDYGAALEAIAAELRGPIDRYFTEVFVMVDDEAVRANRLGLLAAIAQSVTRLAHFHQLAT